MLLWLTLACLAAYLVGHLSTRSKERKVVRMAKWRIVLSSAVSVVGDFAVNLAATAVPG